MIFLSFRCNFTPCSYVSCNGTSLVFVKLELVDRLLHLQEYCQERVEVELLGVTTTQLCRRL